MCVGVVCIRAKTNCIPGWYPGSIGFKSNGSLLNASYKEIPYGKPWSRNDVVGW